VLKTVYMTARNSACPMTFRFLPADPLPDRGRVAYAVIGLNRL
jgi:hypothetical protein